jgi:hypothetical protein
MRDSMRGRLQGVILKMDKFSNNRVFIGGETGWGGVEPPGLTSQQEISFDRLERYAQKIIAYLDAAPENDKWNLRIRLDEFKRGFSGSEQIDGRLGDSAPNVGCPMLLCDKKNTRIFLADTFIDSTRQDRLVLGIRLSGSPQQMMKELYFDEPKYDEDYVKTSISSHFQAAYKLLNELAEDQRQRKEDKRKAQERELLEASMETEVRSVMSATVSSLDVILTQAIDSKWLNDPTNGPIRRKARSYVGMAIARN